MHPAANEKKGIDLFLLRSRYLPLKNLEYATGLYFTQDEWAMKYGYRQQIRENMEHAIRVKHGSSLIVHADTSKRDRKQMEAIYPDFDSVDRNKDSLQLNKVVLPLDCMKNMFVFIVITCGPDFLQIFISHKRNTAELTTILT